MSPRYYVRHAMFTLYRRHRIDSLVAVLRNRYTSLFGRHLSNRPGYKQSRPFYFFFPSYLCHRVCIRFVYRERNNALWHFRPNITYSAPICSERERERELVGITCFNNLTRRDSYDCVFEKYVIKCCANKVNDYDSAIECLLCIMVARLLLIYLVIFYSTI